MNTTDTNNSEKFYGKYRGTVVNNIDPLRMGRIQVTVPDISITPLLSWAMPCIPWAGQQMGIYVVPLIGTGVWIEFEQGDIDYPIWVGCWWGSTPEVPSVGSTLTTPGTPVIVIQSPSQSGMVLSDLPVPPMKGPGVMLFSGSTSITLDDSGVTITAPTVTITSTAVNITGTTNINEGALVVT